VLCLMTGCREEGKKARERGGEISVRFLDTRERDKGGRLYISLHCLV
jgi:hypothetical protein